MRSGHFAHPRLIGRITAVYTVRNPFPLLFAQSPEAEAPYLLGHLACAKRPVSLSEIEDMVDAVEESLEASDAREISSQEVGELVMRHLQGTDQVAYVRFASVYRNFQDTTEFMEEVHELVTRARYRARGQQELFDAPDEASE